MRTRTGIGLAVMLGVGCGGAAESSRDWEMPPRETSGGTAAAGQADHAGLVAAGEAVWAERGDEAKLRECIAKWEAALALEPNDHELWVRLSRAYYFLADGHLSFREDAHDEMMATFEKGKEAATHAVVALSPAFAERMRDGARIEEAVSVLGADAVPALYWRATNLGKWASAMGFATMVAYKDEIRAVMTRCLELDANYFHAGPHRYFGAFYARAPGFAGGDLEKSREHFEASLRQAPEYFATRVLYAADYARKMEDRRLFEEQLNTVISGDPNADPSVAPENVVEQRKARDLLARVGEFFD